MIIFDQLAFNNCGKGFLRPAETGINWELNVINLNIHSFLQGRKFFILYRMVGRTWRGLLTPGYVEPYSFPSKDKAEPRKRSTAGGQRNVFSRAGIKLKTGGLSYLQSGLVVVVQSLSCVRLFCDPTDSPPGTSIHGIFQARILEWVAISFSTVRITNGNFPSSRDQRMVKSSQCFRGEE